MIQESGPPLLFNPRTRARLRDRAQTGFAAHDFLYRYMLDGLLERLGDVTRDFRRALVIGCPDTSARDALVARGMDVTCADPGARNATLNGGIQAEEDALDGAVCRWNEQDAAVLGLEIMGGRHSAQRL